VSSAFIICFPNAADIYALSCWVDRVLQRQDAWAIASIRCGFWLKGGKISCSSIACSIAWTDNCSDAWAIAIVRCNSWLRDEVWSTVAQPVHKVSGGPSPSLSGQLVSEYFVLGQQEPYPTANTTFLPIPRNIQHENPTGMAKGRMLSQFALLINHLVAFKLTAVAQSNSSSCSTYSTFSSSSCGKDQSKDVSEARLRRSLG